MALRDLLVACNGTEASKGALSLALALAQRYDAHLTGLFAHDVAGVAAQLSPWIGSDVMADLQARERGAAAEVKAGFTSRVAEAGRADKAAFLDSGGAPDVELTRAARCHDLTLVGRFDAAHDHERIALHPDRIALASGRPLIVVPPEPGVGPLPTHALIAWDSKRAAARAVADAMPLLELVRQVTIVTVDGAPAEDDLVAHLDRHGIPASLVQRTSAPKGVAAAIRAAAQDAGADLLVMGAYEHSKLSEDLIGGVTRDMLHAAPIPVLIAH